MFSRLICMAVGHKSYSEVKIPEIPKSNSKSQPSFGIPGSINIANALNQNYAALGASIGSNNSNGYAPTSIMSITNFPRNMELKICCRCYHVYWKSDLNSGEICSVKRLPELEQLRQLKERAVWEEKQRRKNSIADRLYKQYLTALKLAYKEDEE